MAGRVAGRPPGPRRLQPRDVPEQPQLLLPGQLPGLAAPDAELRPALGLLRRDRRGRGAASAASTPRAGAWSRGRASSTTRTGTTSRPRVSAAWDLTATARPSLRAGWGLYYDAFSQDFFVGQIPWNTFNPGVGLQRGRRVQLLARSAAAVRARRSSRDFSASDVFTVDPKLRTPYVQNYNVNLQRQLGAHAALQIGYVGSAGRKLFRYPRHQPGRSRDGRAPLPGLLLHQPVRVDAPARATTRCRRACASRGWQGPHLDAQLHTGRTRSTPRATARTTCRTPRSPTTAATPAASGPTRTSTCGTGWCGTSAGSIGGASGHAAALGLVAERHRHARERDALQRRSTCYEDDYNGSGAVLRPARPRRRSATRARRRPTAS